jgi:hypothetical protein
VATICVRSVHLQASLGDHRVSRHEQSPRTQARAALFTRRNAAIVKRLFNLVGKGTIFHAPGAAPSQSAPEASNLSAGSRAPHSEENAMKRHVTSLLQRKRVDFDGAQLPRQNPDRQRHGLVREEIQVKDGYDWLKQIHSSNHRQIVQSRHAG